MAGDSKMARYEKTVYVKAEQCSKVSSKKVLIEDVAKLYGTDKQLVRELNREVLMIIQEDKRKKYIFSILKVLEAMNQKHPEVEWNNVGEQDFIVEYSPPKKSSRVLDFIKTVFVCLAVFFGSAFTIMTFNQDVSVVEVFQAFEEMILGKGQESGVMEFTYSIGLPLGVILFFNHFSRVRMDSDPTPLQVQMRVYEENVNKAIIENASREKNEIETKT